MQAQKRLQEKVVQIAIGAGETLMSYFGQKLVRGIKSSPEDFVTEADRASETFIIAALQEEFSEDDIIAEEAGLYKANQAEYTWIIDPLDGTYSFVHNHTNFAVMIVRAHGSELELAVVYYPSLGTVIKSERGQGTFLDMQKVTLNDLDTSKKPICFESKTFAILRKAGYKLINVGASGNILATVSGQSRAFISNNGKVWDFAPPALLLEEMGWIVTDFSGNKYRWNGARQEVLAAPFDLHKELLSVLKAGI